MSTPAPDAPNPLVTWHAFIIGAATVALPFVVWAILLSQGLDWSSYTGEPLTDAEQRAFDAKDRAAVIVTAAGPAAIALYAAIVQYRKTAAVYLILALTLTCWMGTQERVQDLFAPPPVEMKDPGNDQCVPISGSDRTCPGG
ncbi:hypothetical protein GCM10009853_100550 [Glycomyces scopariae]